MEETDYDIKITEDKQVDYTATIDETGRFDALLTGMPWPANRGDVPTNQDARKLHGQIIHVVEELVTSSMAAWVRFEHNGELVWLTKTAIIPPLQSATYTNVSYMAILSDDVNYPLFAKPPYTAPHAHIPTSYVWQQHLNNQSVNLIQEATLANGHRYVSFIYNDQLYWVRRECLQHPGKALPTIRIEKGVDNLDNGKAVLPITVTRGNGDSQQLYGLVSYQGNFTAQFPRKNLEVTFYDDLTLTQPHPLAFGGWQPRAKFSLRADYYDQTHVRNTTGFKLWRELLASEADYQAHSRDKEMLGTIQGTPVIVTIDGKNQGLYTLFSYFDAASLQLNPQNDHEILLLALNGEIGGKYLAFGNDFAYLNESDFDVMSSQYPSNQHLKADTNRLMRFINQTSDADFRAHAHDYFSPLNLIDYLLFIGVLNAYDNEAHNMSAFTYDGQYWLFSLLDLDISFNIEARGALLTNNDPLLKNIQAPLMKRISQCFTSEVKQRWADLRQTTLTVDHILAIYQQSMAAIGDENYVNDQATWQSPTGVTSSYRNVKKFLEKQLPACDEIIKKL
jgi:hypothetical protein